MLIDMPLTIPQKICIFDSNFFLYTFLWQAVLQNINNILKPIFSDGVKKEKKKNIIFSNLPFN